MNKISIKIQQQLNSKLIDIRQKLLTVTHNIGYNEADVQEILADYNKVFKKAHFLLNQEDRTLKVGYISINQNHTGHYITAKDETPTPISETELFKIAEIHNAVAEAYIYHAASLTAPYLNSEGTYSISIIQPITVANKLLGYLMIEEAFSELIKIDAINQIKVNYAISIVDENNKLIDGSNINERIKYNKIAAVVDKIFDNKPFVMVIPELKIRIVMAHRINSANLTLALLLCLLISGVITTLFLILSIILEIRQRKIQKQLLKETNYRNALEASIPVGVQALDLNGVITYANPTFCKMLGVKSNDIIGTRPYYSYWNKKVKQQAIDNLTNKTNNITNITTNINTFNDTCFDAQIFITPLNDGNNNQIGWLHSIIDISEAEKIRKQLTNSFSQFASMLETIDASVSVALVGDKKLVYSNKLYNRWFNKNHQNHFQLLRNRSFDSNTNKINLNVKRKIEIYEPNLKKWLDIRTHYLNWTNSRLAQMVIALDITEQRNIQAQNAIQQEKIIQQNRLIAVSEIASSVAHELNQPLAAINNYCNGLISRIKAQKIDQAQILAMLEKVNHQAKRASKIIQRIREFVKRREMLYNSHNVKDIINTVIETTNLILINNDAQLIDQTNPNLPSLTVDHILIEQVLVNLVKNAAEAINNAKHEYNSRIIKIQAEQKIYNEHDIVEFSVIDTGTGITQEVKNQLFDSFFSTKPDGMGIGLNLCKSIVESHHGRIQANNIYNNNNEVIGSCFSFWIPVNISDLKTLNQGEKNDSTQ